MNLTILNIAMVILSILISINGSDAAKLKLEDLSVEFLNDTFFDVDTFEYTMNYNPNFENTVNFKFNVLKDFPEDSKIKTTVFTRVFGRKVPTGISQSSHLCDDTLTAVINRWFYEFVLKPIGVKQCPPTKGSYGNENLIIDFSSLPIPPGLFSGANLMIDILLHSKNYNIVLFQAFVTF